MLKKVESGQVRTVYEKNVDGNSNIFANSHFKKGDGWKASQNTNRQVVEQEISE